MQQLSLFETSAPPPPASPAPQGKPQTLRDYQLEAVTATHQAFEDGFISPLLALSTGAGKTTILAELVKQLIVPSVRGMVIAHTEEIVFQLTERITNQTGQRPGIVMNIYNEKATQVLVGTVQSLYEQRLREVLKHGAVDYLFIDECHHSASPTYLSLIETCREYNPDLRVIGFTATPERGDKKGLGLVFDTIAYEWLIPEGVKAGFLVPVTRKKIATEVDLSSLKNAHGDYQKKKLISILKAKNWIDLASDAYMQHVHPTGRYALAFFPVVDMSEAFTARLCELGVRARHIDANTPKDVRRALIGSVLRGEVDCVSNVGIMTEGVDLPGISAIFLARPTRSRVLFTQILGRGLRPFPGKKDCLLIDLSVKDTKALQLGSLLGKMTTCGHCGVEFLYGLAACPLCGAEVPRRLDVVYCECGTEYPRSLYNCPTCGKPKPMGIGGSDANEPDRPYEGAGVVNYQTLFEGIAAWYHGHDGLFSCASSFDEGSFVIQPPTDTDDYRLLYVPKNNRAKVEERARDTDLLALMMQVNQVVENSAHAKQLSREAQWREQQASIKQIDYLKTLGVHVPDEISRGEASALITHAIAVKRIK